MITYGDGYNIYNMPQNACYYSTFSISIGPLKTKVFPSYSINTEFCKAGKKADSLVFCDDMCGGEVKEVNGKKGYISDLCINSSELYEDKYLVLSTGYDIFGDFDFYLYASDPPKNYTELDAENLIEEFINYVYLYKTALPDLDENMNICALTFYPESIDPEEYDLMGNVVVKAQDWYVSYNQKLEEIMAENGLEVCYMDQYNPKLWWE
jgi:hypothetical protein